MKYEVIREIYNQCENNQMRDIFFDEIDTDDTDSFVKSMFKDEDTKYERFDGKDGSIEYFITTSGLSQKMSFTPLD